MKKKILSVSLYFLFFAVLIILFVVISQFIPNHKKVVIPPTSTPFVAGSPAFMQTLAQMTHSSVESGDAVIPIQGGAAFGPILLNDINDASSSIMIANFAWDGGTFSKQIFDALTAAAHRNVSVFLLLDAFGCRTIPKSWIKTLEDAGGKVAEYHQFNLFNPLQYNVRDHTRAFIFDDKVAFTGGVGIVDYWIKPSQGFNTWRDLMFEVHGNMVKSIEGDFNSLWGTPISVSSQGILSSTSSSSLLKATSTQYVSVSGMPTPKFQPVRDVFFLTALSAQKKLYMESPYTIPDQDFLNVLEAKARAGVDVRIVTPGSITSGPLLRDAWHGDYEQLLKAGVRIYEYQPTMIHSKMMMADDVWSVIGSANIDNRSETINVESVLGVSDSALAQNLDTIFMTDSGQSKEITLDEWNKQYGLLDRFITDFWLIFARQL